MIETIKPFLGVIIVFGIPGVTAAVLSWIFARRRGRNPLIWAIVSSILPVFVFVLYFKKPLAEVPGHFRHCPTCGEFSPWKYGGCIYCTPAGQGMERKP